MEERALHRGVVSLERRWRVEVVVEGFGPAHPLWGRFVEKADVVRDGRLEWELTQPTNGRGRAGRIEAIVTAVTPDEAVRKLMKAVREVGRSVDRAGTLSWVGLSGRALLAS